MNNWQKILNSPMSSVYTSELYWLAKDVASFCEKVFEDAPEPLPAPKSYVKVDHQLHSTIYTILSMAARIRTMLVARPKSKGQSNEIYEVQGARIAWLNSLLKGVSINEILNAGVRNTLEHYDEYIDETALKSLQAIISRPTLFPMDMSIGREGTIQGNVYYLRVYIAESKKFINAGKTINLAALHDECAGIRDKIAPLLSSTEDSEDRGSSMIVITDRSYDS